MNSLTFTPDVQEIAIDQEFFENLLYEGDIDKANSWDAAKAAQLVFYAFCAATDTPDDYRVAFARELAELFKNHDVLEDIERVYQNINESKTLICVCGNVFSPDMAQCPKCFELAVNGAAIGVRDQLNGLLNSAELVLHAVNLANTHSTISNNVLSILASNVSACNNQKG